VVWKPSDPRTVWFQGVRAGSTTQDQLDRFLRNCTNRVRRGQKRMGDFARKRAI